MHLFRQEQAAGAEHTNNLLGLGHVTDRILQLVKGTHILMEGRPEIRPPRTVCHVRTDLDRLVNYTDGAITGGADAPASPVADDLEEAS